MTSHGRKYHMVREVQSARSACCAVQISIFPGVAQKSSTPLRLIVTSLVERQKGRKKDVSRRSCIFEDLLLLLFEELIIPKRSSREKWVAYRSRPRFDPNLSRSVQESVSGVSRTSSGGSSRSSHG